MKDSSANTSQDYDRKHGKNHIASNPRAVKDLPSEDDTSEGDTGTTDNNQKTAEIISKGHTIETNPSLKPEFAEDKRKTVRHEHTNHFTNRAKPQDQ